MDTNSLSENHEPEKGDKHDAVESFHSSTRIIVSKTAYLIGVNKKHFESEYEPPQLEYYEELEKNQNARIIRELCRLRTAIERSFGYINRRMQREFCTILSMPEYVPSDAIAYLASVGINIVKRSIRQPVDYIRDINRTISDRINNCRELFPIWLNFAYLRELFIMPDGLTTEGTKHAAATYYANRHKYPYQMYINWIPDECGNILYNDKKFCTLLYKMHGDCFLDISRVTDAKSSVKNSIYEFVEASNKTVAVVDCENSDPYKLIATLNNLEGGTLSKISKIFLYNDIHASTAWQLFESYCNIADVEHVMTERVKESKSLVDIKLSVGVSKEFYKNAVDSFIVVSSDSDYWGLIDSLPEARFLVMVEREKCGADIKAALDGRNIFFCYIDDFCTGNSNEIKIAALLCETKRYLSEHISLNVEVMLDEVYKNTRVRMTQAECTQFYNKYIRPMHLIIEKNGDVRVELRGK